MPKVSLYTLTNIDNPTQFVSQVNENFADIAAQIELLYSRDGEFPNTQLANMDMNAYRIINLPAPTSATEPARHGDIQQYVDQAEAAQEAAEEAQEAAETAQEGAETAEENTEALLDVFLGIFGGSFAEDPDTDGLQNGFFYYNTEANTFRIWKQFEVYVGTDEISVGADDVYVSYWVDLPMTTLRSMSDTDLTTIANGQGIRWNSALSVFVPKDFSAEEIAYDDTTTDLNADNVQEAIEDLVNRTSLGVYDLAFWAGGLLENNETLFRMVAGRTFWIPINATDSIAQANVAANAETTLTLRVNGTPFGTIVFPAASDEGIFTVGSTTVFNSGDIFSVTNQPTADTSLRDVSFTIAARR